MRCRLSLRHVFGLAAASLVVSMSAASAPAQCTLPAEARQISRSLKRLVNCNLRMLARGLGIECKLIDSPACAGTLVADSVGLAFGSNNPPAAAVDRRSLGDQLRCQRAIGKATTR